MPDQTNPDTPQGQQSSSAKPELRQHELVDKLAPDPSQLQPLTILSGFLGQSPRAGYWRLYLTPTLDEYVDIPEGDIVHSQSPEPGQPTTDETTLWVRSGSPLQYTHTTSRQVQAEFLQGAITTGFKAQMTDVPAAMAPRAGFLAATHVQACLSDACGSDVVKYCPSTWGCFTSRIQCGRATNGSCFPVC